MILTLADIKINYDFENLLPKQTADQFRQMEENMIAEGGAHDPLIIWDGHDVLLDGHHRMRVLKAHPELSWYPKYVSLTDEDDAKEWIIKKAIGERNLTPIQQEDLTGQLLDMRKGRRGGTAQRGNNGRYQKSQNETSGKADVAQEIADELGIARSSVYRAADTHHGLDAIDAVIPGSKNEILSGKLPYQKAEIRGATKQTPEQIEAVHKHVEERGGKKNKSEDRELSSKVKDTEKAMYSAAVTQYDLTDLLREIDALGDSFVDSLNAMIKRRSNVIESYNGGSAMVREHIETIITKINDMKKGFGYV